MTSCPICHHSSKGVFDTQYVSVQKCENQDCRHLFAEKSHLVHGVMEYTDGCDFSKYYDRNIKLVNYLLNKSYLQGNKKVLDLGSGTGHIAKTFLDQGCDVTCIELSETAREILDAKGLTSYPDLNSIPNGQTYDIILMVEVIEHISMPAEILLEVRKYLSPHGFLFLTTPCSTGLKVILNRNKSSSFSCPEHLHFFNSKSLEYCLQASGFSQFNREYVDFMVPGESFLKKSLNRALYSLNLNAHLVYLASNS